MRNSLSTYCVTRSIHTLMSNCVITTTFLLSDDQSRREQSVQRSRQRRTAFRIQVSCGQERVVELCPAKYTPHLISTLHERNVAHSIPLLHFAAHSNPTFFHDSVMNAGCCKVLLHPQWGSAVYPATLFTTAPSSRVLKLLNLLKDGCFDEKLAF